MSIRRSDLPPLCIAVYKTTGTGWTASGTIHPVPGNSVDANTANRMMSPMELPDATKDLMPALLNEVEALIHAGIGTLAELADFLLPHKPKNQRWTRTHEWIMQRRYPIGQGEVALRLVEWHKAATAKADGDPALSRKFHVELRKVNKARKEPKG